MAARILRIGSEAARHLETCLEQEQWLLLLHFIGQGKEEIRKPSSVINAKKWRKTTEKERLEISWEKAMAPHSCTVAWKIPWMEEPGRLQSMGSLRVRHD